MNKAPNGRFRLCRVDAENPKTWALLVRMDHECFGYEAPALTDNSGAWWIVYLSGVPCAYGAIKQVSEHCGYMHRAGVLKDYRGCGLQKKLIMKRLEHAKQEGWNYVVTDTSENVESGNSLISCGFKLYKPENPWAFSHSCYWRKFLLPQFKLEVIK